MFELRRWLGVVSFAGAAILLLLTVVSILPDMDGLSNLLSLAIGIGIAPAFTIGLGLSIGRAAQDARHGR